MTGLNRIVVAAAALCFSLCLAAPNQVTSNNNNFRRSAEKGDQFLVSLKRGLTKRDLDIHVNWINDLTTASGSGGSDEGAVNSISYGNFHAYYGKLDTKTVESINGHPEVHTIEESIIMTGGVMIKQEDSTWGLGTISHRGPPANASVYTDYIYDSSAGTGTFAYVVDSGIAIGHSEFGGRASFGANFVTNTPDTDEHGHGTHVASTIVSNAWGVAKNASVIAVKVLNRYNRGDMVDIMRGIEWAAKDIKSKGRVGRAVINASVGGLLKSDAWDTFMQEVVDSGIMITVAAMNEADNVNNWTPARSPASTTVGNMASDYTMYSSSNYGCHVDIFGPGTDILGADAFNLDGGSTYYTGTSMAAPHVAGVALYLQALEGPAGIPDAKKLEQRIKDIAVRGAIKGPRKGSPNLLLYNGNGA